MSRQMDEARRVLLKSGFKIVKEGYEDATTSQMQGMRERLQKYIDTGSEFKIKSKSNPLGLVVNIVKYKDDIYVLYNSNTGAQLAKAESIDDMIKRIYNIQAELDTYQEEESFMLDMRKNVEEALNEYDYIIIPEIDIFEKYLQSRDVTYLNRTTLYLHGEAEDEATFDIARAIPGTADSEMPKTKAKSNVGILTTKGIKDGIMMTWPDPAIPGYTKGIIVYPHDKEALDYANKLFDNPPRFF